MKTFTARDMSRSAAAVLAASDIDGVASIRTRDGRAYELRPVTTSNRDKRKQAVADAIDRHLKRILELKKKYHVPPITGEQWEAIDRSMTERPTEFRP